jgi:antitoxin (DNA-binding transcriptional repressor) of toxin-antitoxin stability system
MIGELAMLTKIIDVGEVQMSLKELLSLVVEGTEIVITEGSIPLARLVPIVSPNTPRIAGLHSEAIWTSSDFDEPLPEEFWTGEV